MPTLGGGGPKKSGCPLAPIALFDFFLQPIALLDFFPPSYEIYFLEHVTLFGGIKGGGAKVPLREEWLFFDVDFTI